MENYQRLKDLREDNDLKQWQIAELLGMKQEKYQRYESGKRETPIKILIKLSEYYNVTLDYITGRTNDKKSTGEEFEQDEKIIVDHYRRLTEKQRKIIFELIKELGHKAN